MISAPTFHFHPQKDGLVGHMVIDSPYIPDYRFWLKKEDFTQINQAELKGWLLRYQSLAEEYISLHEKLFSIVPGGRFEIDKQKGQLQLDWLSRPTKLYGEDFETLKTIDLLALKRAVSQVAEICQVVPEFNIEEISEMLNWKEGFFRTSYEAGDQELVARVRLEPAPESDPWFGTRAKLEQIPSEAEAPELAQELKELRDLLTSLPNTSYTVRINKVWGEEVLEIKSAHQLTTELNQYLQFGVTQVELAEFKKNPQVPKPYEVEANYLEGLEEVKNLLELYTPEIWD